MRATIGLLAFCKFTKVTRDTLSLASVFVTLRSMLSYHFSDLCNSLEIMLGIYALSINVDF